MGKPQRIGEKFKRLRLSQNMTLVELSHAIGFSSHGFISEIESGKKIPSIEVLLKYSDLFNVSIDSILRDEIEVVVQQDQRKNTNES